MISYVVQANATCWNNRSLARASDGRLWAGFIWATEVYVAYSDDEGETWNLEQVTTTPGIGITHPTIAIDSQDNLHIAWRQELLVPDYNIQYRKRNASGVWDAEELVSTDPGAERFPRIAIDSSDNVHVVWHSTTDPIAPFTHVVKYRMRTAVAWQAVESVSDPLAWLEWLSSPFIAIGSDDIIHVTWSSQACGLNPADYNIQYKQRIGGVWQAQEGATDIAASQYMPVVAIDASNDVHVLFLGRGWGANPGVYNMRYIKRTAGVWGASEAITDVATAQSIFGSLRYHSIALDVAGDIHVVWSADGWGVSIADTNVQYRRKTGGVWQAQEGLTDRPDDQGSTALMWAMFPIIAGQRTNIPLIGYAFLLNGDLLGDNRLEYWTEAGWLSAPTVTTDVATGVGVRIATLNGTLDDDGGEACICGFQWGESPALGKVTSTQSKVTGEKFAHALSSLSPKTKYYFRAVATNSA